MKRVIDRFRNLSVSWKFVLAYFAILIVPVVMTGIYLYYQNSNSAIKQARLVIEQNLLQTKASIIQKQKVIENLSQVLASDAKFSNFLDTVYDNEVDRIIDYQFEYSPYVKTVIQQNNYIYSIMIYMENTIVTEMLNSYYSIRASDSPELYARMREKEPAAYGWESDHSTASHLLDGVGDIQVFSYSVGVAPKNYYNRVGVIEVEIREDVLFDMLRDPVIGKMGEVFMVGDDRRIVSDNIPALFKKDVSASGLQSFDAGKSINSLADINGVRSIVISIPVKEIGCSIVGVFPVSNFNSEVKKSMNRIIIVILISSMIMGFIIYFTTNALLSRLKKLVRAMKQVKDDNLDVSVPVGYTDEFGELALSFNHMTGRIHELVEMVLKSRILEREAELKAWETQINPHFLYNTLATISWIARKDGSAEIVKLSNSLAKFYRLVLSKGRSLICVREELDMVMAFLQIQKVRFDDLFDVVYVIDEELLDCKMIKNILQPIIENALYHGIEAKRAHGTIVIELSMTEGRLCFRIIDDGVGMGAVRLKEVMSGMVEKSGGSGYAIKNILERLKSFYGAGWSFDIFSRPGIGSVITIMLEAVKEDRAG